MAREDYVTISGVDIGIDSNSGLAFSCEIDGVHFWVPYSQVKARHTNKKVHGQDSIEVARWWAEKNEVEFDG